MKFKYLVIIYDGAKRIKKLFVVPAATSSETAKRTVREARNWKKKDWKMSAMRFDKFDQLWSWG